MTHNPVSPGPPTRARLGILLSGRGSNFGAIARAVERGSVPAEIAVVISNRPTAGGLYRARRLGLNALALPSAGRDRDTCDRELAAALREHRVDWVCLAGYMRLAGAPLLEAFPLRILNIHPSLLPAFPGLEAQRQAFDYGVKVAGCTVHLVDASLDGGPIVAQRAVAVRDEDDAHTLAARILRAEHRLYPAALARLLGGGWRIVGRRVEFNAFNMQ